MLVFGGMPQAVLTYVKNRDFAAVDRIKKEILKIYRSKDIMVKEGVIHLPIYMAMFL